jgi:nicotinamidase-related amidase
VTATRTTKEEKMGGDKIKVARRMAFITTDLQYDLIRKSPEREKRVRDMLPSVTRFLNQLRERKIPIIHQQLVYQETDHVEYFNGIIPCLDGTDGVRFIPELEVEKDIVIEKRKDSGFYETNLDETLRNLGCDTILLGGMQAQICIQTTGADGYFRGYNVVAVEDCITSTREEDKQRALDWIRGYCGRVMASQDIIAAHDSGRALEFPVIYTP